MKRYFLFILLGIFSVSCGSRSNFERVLTGEAQTLKEKETSAKSLTVNTSLSKINWKGFKPGGGHHGTLSLMDGVLEMKGDTIIGGHFIIDMNTIMDDDLNDDNKSKLIAHLKSADFFDVAQFPTAEFLITSAMPPNGTIQQITGNLTLKGTTKSISFPVEVYVGDWDVTATTPAFTIDRTQWGVNYGSKNIFKNLADSFIDDEIEVQIKIKTE